jgi:hypothetical protein
MLPLVLLGLLLNTLVPARTSRLHLGHGMDQWLGDSRHAIRVCAKRIRVRRFIDLNFQRCLDGVMNLHSRTATANGYRFIRRRFGLGRRAMTHAELHRPLEKWKAADVRRWRRTKHRGLSLESRVFPRTFLEQVLYAKPRGVTVCAELKSGSFDEPRVAVQMVAAVKRVGASVIFMTLVTMPHWAGKMRAFHTAGGRTALLAHGAPRPAVLDQYQPFIDRIWGDFA